MKLRSAKIRNSGLLLGMGLAGLLDAVAFGRMLAWFHLAMWIATLAGIAVLFSAVRGPGPLPRARVFAGWILVGGGAIDVIHSGVERNWPLLAAAAFALVMGAALVRRPSVEDWIERRSGHDRRSPAAERVSRGA